MTDSSSWEKFDPARAAAPQDYICVQLGGDPSESTPGMVTDGDTAQGFTEADAQRLRRFAGRMFSDEIDKTKPTDS